MPGWKYYSLTVILYTVCILGAIFVEDIAIVFDFAGAFGLSLTAFTLPGIMYLRLLRNDKAFYDVESDR